MIPDSGAIPEKVVPAPAATPATAVPWKQSLAEEQGSPDCIPVDSLMPPGQSGVRPSSPPE